MTSEILVPQLLEGQGLASRLAKAIIADPKAGRLVILPVCPYVSAFLQKHPERADVVHPTYRRILGI